MKSLMVFLLVLFALIFGVVQVNASEYLVTIDWSWEYSMGDPLEPEELGGFYVHYRTEPETINNTTDVGTDLSYSLMLDIGYKYFFSVATYSQGTINGVLFKPLVIGDYSPEMEVNLLAPPIPTDIRLRLQIDGYPPLEE